MSLCSFRIDCICSMKYFVIQDVILKVFSVDGLKENDLKKLQVDLVVHYYYFLILHHR